MPDVYIDNKFKSSINETAQSKKQDSVKSPCDLQRPIFLAPEEIMKYQLASVVKTKMLSMFFDDFFILNIKITPAKNFSPEAVNIKLNNKDLCSVIKQSLNICKIRFEVRNYQKGVRHIKFPTSKWTLFINELNGQKLN